LKEAKKCVQYLNQDKSVPRTFQFLAQGNNGNLDGIGSQA